MVVILYAETILPMLTFCYCKQITLSNLFATKINKWETLLVNDDD